MSLLWFFRHGTLSAKLDDAFKQLTVYGGFQMLLIYHVVADVSSTLDLNAVFVGQTSLSKGNAIWSLEFHMGKLMILKEHYFKRN